MSLLWSVKDFFKSKQSVTKNIQIYVATKFLALCSHACQNKRACHNQQKAQDSDPW